MTLIGTAATHSEILLVVDSMLSAGYRWSRGTKLFVVRSDCAAAFEGSTNLALPLLTGAINFIAHSDNLQDVTKVAPSAVFERMKLDIEEIYKNLAQDRCFDLKLDFCSFVFAAWCPRLNQPVCYQLTSPRSGQPDWVWKDHSTSLQNGTALFVGNGDLTPVTVAEQAFANGSGTPTRKAYDAVLQVIDDKAETSVGGQPQIVLLSDGARQVIGIEDSSGHRWLLGQKILSGAKGQAYHERTLKGVL